ncbi:hypothetical protein ABPG73_006321, partial [Tetrahymena malaccensis]
MANLLEEIRSVKPQNFCESQNYLSGYLLCVTDDISNEQKLNKHIKNKQVEEILIKENTLRQINLDITIQKKTQAFISRFTKQQNLKDKYQSLFNVQNNQLAIILNSDPFSQKKQNTQSLSFTSQIDSQSNKQSQQNNYSQLNKQSQGNKDFENNTTKQSQKIILISNQSSKQNFYQIQEQMIDQLNSYQENFQENSLEKQNIIQQIVVESNISDYFNQKHVLAYQESSQPQNEKDKSYDYHFNGIHEKIQFKQSFTELVFQIELDFIQNYYYLTDFVQSFEYEDMYLGYQNKDNIKSQTLVFKIIYNPSQQNKTIEWDEQTNLKSDRIISCSNTAKILVMKYDNYIQIMQKFSFHKEQIKGCTKKYAPPEQLENFLIIDSKADIYSLGKTFLDIIEVYEKQSEEKEFIKKLKNLIEDKMVQQNAEQRGDCLKLHNEFLMIILQLNSAQFLKYYLDNISNILNQLPQNNDKDIPYFAQLDL